MTTPMGSSAELNASLATTSATVKTAAPASALAGEPIEPASLGNGEEQTPALVHMPSPITASRPVAPCFNRIYYGPPGTGKTTFAKAMARLLRQDREGK